LTLLLAGLGGRLVGVVGSLSICMFVVVALTLVGDGVAVVNATVFVEVREQRAHRHCRNPPCFVLSSLKKHSPLSSGNISAMGKGGWQPRFVDIVLTCQSSK